NFATRYLVNDACVLLEKPLIYGSVFKFEGQVSVFNYKENFSAKTSINYRDLFPEPPKPDQIPNCAEAGVIGVLPGIIGSLMCNEAIKVITGIAKPLSNRLLTFNSLETTFMEFEISPNPDSTKLLPKSIDEFKRTNYDLVCGVEGEKSENS